MRRRGKDLRLEGRRIDRCYGVRDMYDCEYEAWLFFALRRMGFHDSSDISVSSSAQSRFCTVGWASRFLLSIDSAYCKTSSPRVAVKPWCVHVVDR